MILPNGMNFIWNEKYAFTVELLYLEYLENFLYARSGLSFPPLISCLNIYLSSNSVQVWSALVINFSTLLKPECQYRETNSLICTSLTFCLMTNNGSSYITWLGLMLWITTSNLYSASGLSLSWVIDMVRLNDPDDEETVSAVEVSSLLRKGLYTLPPRVQLEIKSGWTQLANDFAKTNFSGPMFAQACAAPSQPHPTDLLPTVQMHLFACFYF